MGKLLADHQVQPEKNYAKCECGCDAFELVLVRKFNVQERETVISQAKLAASMQNSTFSEDGVSRDYYDVSTYVEENPIAKTCLEEEWTYGMGRPVRCMNCGNMYTTKHVGSIGGGFFHTKAVSFHDDRITEEDIVEKPCKCTDSK